MRSDGNARGAVGDCAGARATGTTAQERQSLADVMNDNESNFSWVTRCFSARLFVSDDVEPGADGVAGCWVAGVLRVDDGRVLDQS